MTHITVNFQTFVGKCRGVQVEEYMYGVRSQESQDLTCTKCSEHIESEPSGQIFVLSETGWVGSGVGWE